MSSTLVNRRTLFLTSSYPAFAGDFSGHFVRSHALAERASQRSVQVLAFGDAPSHPGQTRSELDPGIDVTWLGGGALFGAPGVLPRLDQRRSRLALLVVPLLRALCALRQRERYDRVVAHFLLLTGWPLGIWFSQRSGRLPAAELEIVAHGSDVRLFEQLPAWLRRRIVKDLARNGARVRFVSAELRERMAKSAGSMDSAHYITAQAVAAMPLELPPLPTKQRARLDVGADEDAWLIVVMGRLTRGKRVRVALSAAELVPNGQVVVIGDGPEREQLSNDHPEVRFVGAVGRERALTWMRAADLLISASLLEGAPTAVREARILGIPVVATAAGDLRSWSLGDPDVWVVG
jgi:glycosyltransferase involved in cell wall biosynthesis